MADILGVVTAWWDSNGPDVAVFAEGPRCPEEREWCLNKGAACPHFGKVSSESGLTIIQCEGTDSDDCDVTDAML